MPRNRRRRRRSEDPFGEDPWGADMLGADMQKSAERFGREAARFADQVNSSIHRMKGAFDDEMKRRDGYAYHAGEPGPGPNPHRLYRNPKRGRIAGVCAGFADYFDWKVRWVRIAAILATVFFFPLPIFVYAAAALFMKTPGTDYRAYDSPEEERFWRNYTVRPKVTYSELRHRFRALESRIEQMEYAVTSNEYGLRRQFKDLERGL